MVHVCFLLHPETWDLPVWFACLVTKRYPRVNCDLAQIPGGWLVSTCSSGDRIMGCLVELFRG